MEQLGVKLPLLITQVVNFAIMLIVLTKLLYQPILKKLEERRNKIESGLKMAEQMKVEEEKLAERKKELLKEAKEEERLLLQKAQKEAKQVKEGIVAQGKKEVEQMKEKMQKEMDRQFEKAQKEITAQTVDIAAEMVKRLLPELLTEKEQHTLVMTKLKKLEKRHEK